MGLNPASATSSCVTLDKLLYLSVPQFANLQNGDNGGIYLIGLLGGLNTLTCVQHVEQCLWRVSLLG